MFFITKNTKPQTSALVPGTQTLADEHSLCLLASATAKRSLLRASGAIDKSANQR